MKISLIIRYVACFAAFCVFASTPLYASTTVAAGWDLFQTVSPGTTFGGQEFEGVPLGSYDFGAGAQPTANTDTIVHRLSAANAPSTTINIELTALQLKSVNPTDFGLGPDFYYITLQS